MPLKLKFAQMLEKFKRKHGEEEGERIFHATINKLGISKQKIEKKHVYTFYAPFKPELKAGRVVSTSGVLLDNEEDFYGDICTKRCLKDMVEQIKERNITMDVEHETLRDLKSVDGSLNKDVIPISRITESSYRENGNYARIEIKDRLNVHHEKYSEIEGSIRDKFLTAYSMAFVPLEYKHVEKKSGGENRLLDRVALLNVTYTGVPVNPRANMTDVFFKSLSEERIEEIVEGILNGQPLPFDAESKGFKIETKSKRIGGKSMTNGEEQSDESKESFVEKKEYEDSMDKLKEENGEMKKAMKAMQGQIDTLTDTEKTDESEGKQDDEDKDKTEGKQDDEDKDKTEGKQDEDKEKEDTESKQDDEDEKKDKVEGKAMKKELAELKAKVNKYLGEPQRKGQSVEMKATLEKMVDKVGGPLDTI